MSRAGVRYSVVTVLVVASLVSLESCSKGDLQPAADQQKTAAQQNEADEEAFVAELAPDADTVHINFVCGAIDSIGLTASGKTAWNILRHRNSPIIWKVEPTVTINSIKGKSGLLPIDTVPGEPHGGAGVTLYKATVNANAGASGPPPFPGTHKDKNYSYEIDVTCTAGANSTRLVIDPELIVRRP